MTDYWLNGHLVDDRQARIAPSDRGFLLADGLFETFRAHNGKVLWLTSHLERLRAGAKQLDIPIAFSNDAIGNGLNGLVQKAGLSDAALRLTLTRGPSNKRGLWPSEEPAHPTLLASIAPYVAASPAQLIVSQSTRRNEHSPLSRLKVLAYGDALVAKREALARGATDAVLLNTQGDIACCTVGNLFIRDGNGWATPRLEDGVLNGLARARVLQALGARERRIAVIELGTIHEALITNSLGLAPVTHIEGRALKVSEISTKLVNLYN
ncbi:MAG TPA: aminotransferase class IV [Beijerinckiaceae bacterium]|jgi:branched-subunit amino acid aminotransferase/4-amino-4-deoxychorismate lyase|nr:aminotransferase class IV [Beijerinckiaceae bacterium]